MAKSQDQMRGQSEGPVAKGQLACPPDSPENAVQVFLHLHQRSGVVEETLVHLLHSHTGQVVEVQQHLIGFLKPVKPGEEGKPV